MFLVSLLFQLTDGLRFRCPKFRACGNGSCAVTLMGMQLKRMKKRRKETKYKNAQLAVGIKCDLFFTGRFSENLLSGIVSLD